MKSKKRVIKSRKVAPAIPVVGWREWCSLPDLDVEWIKVKVDTGARSSALHAFDLETIQRRGREYVRFKIHPLQRSDEREVEVTIPVLDRRSVRSSDGSSTRRPVIQTRIAWGEYVWPIELTLARRDQMGFRMLLGREAVRRRFLVDPGGSWYGDRPAGASKLRGGNR